MHMSDFENKEIYEFVMKHLGKLPCEECLVRATCFNTKFNYDLGWYEIYLNQPCDEAITLLRNASSLGRSISMLTDPDYKSNREEVMRKFKRECEILSITIEI